MKKIPLLLLFFYVFNSYSQEYFPDNSGVKTEKNSSVAITNATIHVNASKTIKNGEMLIKDGKIIAVGKSVNIPSGTKVVNLEGKSVYPSFIETFSSFGIEKLKGANSSRGGTQYDASRAGYYWNDHIRPDVDANSFFKFDEKNAKELLQLGFGVVNTHQPDGIVRGNGLLVALNPNITDAYRILDHHSGQYLSFRKSVTSSQSYPGSQMGSMALLRQVYLDADWYAKGNAKNTDLALEALNKNKNLVQIFDAGGKINNLRADKVGDEYGIQYVILGGGDEYEGIADMKATNASFIIPINFRKPYDVSDLNLANQVALSDMRKWNQEPGNLKVLAENGVTFAITTHSLGKVSDFSKNLQKAITYGLSKEDALNALTITPAKILGKENEIGSLEVGKYANFLVTSGDLFEPKTVLFENWVQGNKNVIYDKNQMDLSGEYTLSFGSKSYDVTISGNPDKHKIKVLSGETEVESKMTFSDNWLSITLADENNNYSRLQARIDGVTTNISGNGYNFEGTAIQWNAAMKEPKETSDAKSKPASENDVAKMLPVTFPNKAFGFSEKPKEQTILIKNATIWTSEDDGILENTDLLLKDGKIAKIGKDLKAGGALVIDATGKHVTAGIIDEHSHIAASGVNEGGHNSSAEVQIEDVIDPDDIQIYRTLAGGVTSLQILHGSANPIGGRSAIIKLKWGESASNLVYDNSPKFIKFALGENVKQSRSTNGTRFPQSRMGVQELFVDYFQRAKEYDALKKSGKPYRKDLEMETLAEILNKERFISCHSYVQSEINMLMKVAESFDFRVNTFTHILEGYKVADKMAEHGVGASTFSDWWAYKFEVNDAIPYNASILHNAGVTVSINSDDAEMIRRLNQEAGKTVKYGGVSEEEAWKMVTINPAKLLHLDDRVGSIKVGKDADVVLWSDHPLSVYAKAEKTIIEGKVFFDLERDLEMRKAVQAEKTQLMNMMLQEKNGGAATQAPHKKDPVHFHCDTVLNY